MMTNSRVASQYKVQSSFMQLKIWILLCCYRKYFFLQSSTRDWVLGYTRTKFPLLSLSLSYNLWDKAIPKFQFLCPVLLFFFGLHVKGQVGSFYFGELWPRYRRIGAIRIPENEAKSENEEIGDNQVFRIMHKIQKRKTTTRKQNGWHSLPYRTVIFNA